MSPTARLAAVLALRVNLLDDDACARISPETANAHLAARGFQRVDTETWHVWTLAPTQVAVPRETHGADLGRRMLAVVDDIARHEDRSPLAVWLDLVDPAGIAAREPQARPQSVDDQPALPGLEPPAKVRRTAQHRFGPLRKVHVLGTTLDEAHTEERETCRHCGVERRRANTGKRMGAQVMYLKGGRSWSRVSPVCIPKSK